MMTISRLWIRRLPLAAAAAGCLLAGTLRADTVWIGSGGLKYDADIIGVENGELVYLVAGNRSSRALSEIRQIQLDDEPLFSEAEQAFAAGDWERAVDRYQNTIRRTATDWVKRRSARRLVEAAQKAGRFDAAVSAYTTLVQLDPAAAVDALPQPSPQTPRNQLDAAAGQIEQLLGGRVNDDQRRALLSLLLQVHTQRGDDAAAGRVVEQLARLTGDASNVDPKVFAQLLLGRAKLALEQNKPDEAARLVQENQQVFVDPQQQSEALMVLARAAEQQAGEDPQQLKDAAVAYLKVVAFFKSQPDDRNVPAALLAVGQIHEKLELDESATKVYRQLVEEYPDSPAAGDARDRLAELEAPAS